jgi:hypothetical protein
MKIENWKTEKLKIGKFKIEIKKLKKIKNLN